MKHLALLVTIALTLVACGARDESAAPTSFSGGVCSAVLAWGDDIVDAANVFTDESPHLSIDGRRGRYLFAFDEQRRITEVLRDRIGAAPSTGTTGVEAIRGALLKAVDDVEANIVDQKSDAAAEVDFHFIGPKPDRLFSGTEKSLSLMLKPLDEAARDNGASELGGSCGREP